MACNPCGTLSPRNAGIDYWSRRKTDPIRKAKRASQLKAGKSARSREDAGSEGEITGREKGGDKGKHTQESPLKYAPH